MNWTSLEHLGSYSCVFSSGEATVTHMHHTLPAPAGLNWLWLSAQHSENKDHEIQPVHSEGDQPWDFFGRNDAKAETPVLWPPLAKSWLIGKYSDAGRDWGQEEKGTTENEMAGWHHWLNGREFEWTLGVGDEQGGLACCDSWGLKGRTRLSDWNELNWTVLSFTSRSPLSHWEALFPVI